LLNLWNRFFFKLRNLTSNWLAFNFLGFYNWSIIIEQLQFKFIHSVKNLLAYHRYLPVQHKQNFQSAKWRKLYQFGFRHRIGTPLWRVRRYIYKHFYLLKRPFNRFRRLNGFRSFQRCSRLALNIRRRLRLAQLGPRYSYYQLKRYRKLRKSKKLRRWFARFKKHTGMSCSFKIWVYQLCRSEFIKTFQVYTRKPKGWFLKTRQFERCLSSLFFFPRFKSILLRPTGFSRWVSRRRQKGKRRPSPYFLYSKYHARAFSRRTNLKLKVFKN